MPKQRAIEHTRSSAKPLTLAELARDINVETLAAEVTGRIGKAANEARSAHAIEAGRLLLQAKELVPRGEWLSWLADNCEVSKRSAQEYMQLARTHKEMDPANARRVAHLSLREALKELREPSTTDSPVAATSPHSKPREEPHFTPEAAMEKAEESSLKMSEVNGLAALRLIRKGGAGWLAQLAKVDDSINLEEFSEVFAEAAILAQRQEAEEPVAREVAEA